jgi:alkylation response protein AidB-like acyl-CoA dehydrogenase
MFYSLRPSASAPLITEHAAAAEADRQLSGTVYQAMYDAGLFGMLAPKAYGAICRDVAPRTANFTGLRLAAGEIT